MTTRNSEKMRQAVRHTYGEIAQGLKAECDCAPSSCCSIGEQPTPEERSVGLGYTREELSTIPEGANMGLGCGNPQAIASLQRGESVLDLGSGGGADCFLAAKAVGKAGHVIGVDITPEMIDRARANADEAGLENVEFRLGEIEKIPVADASVDVIISNCVINLSPEKEKVFREAYRILKGGGRLAISDMVATSPVPDELINDIALYTGCLSGAAQIDELERLLEETGFTKIRISTPGGREQQNGESIAGRKIENSVVSATIEAIKPEDDASH